MGEAIVRKSGGGVTASWACRFSNLFRPGFYIGGGGEIKREGTQRDRGERQRKVGRVWEEGQRKIE